MRGSGASRGAQRLIASEERVEKARGVVREADDLVGCLTIELEVELGAGAAVVPVVEGLQLASAERPLAVAVRRMETLTQGV